MPTLFWKLEKPNVWHISRSKILADKSVLLFISNKIAFFLPLWTWGCEFSARWVLHSSRWIPTDRSDASSFHPYYQSDIGAFWNSSTAWHWHICSLVRTESASQILSRMQPGNSDTKSPTKTLVNKIQQTPGHARPRTLTPKLNGGAHCLQSIAYWLANSILF